MTPREECLGRVRGGGVWDVVVIGGGATGLGTAVDAATRGYRTLLLEAHDFAKGTSSRSTKLIHGGVRYLAQGDVGLVREALHERGLLLRNAPHLVHDRAFLVPAYPGGRGRTTGSGLWLYDRLAGAAGPRAVAGPSARAKRSRLRADARADGLRGGVLYHDGQFDDARLAVALARTVDDLGGTGPQSRRRRRGSLKDGRAARGVRARDAETGEEFDVAARVVVNATGVFADEVRRLDDPERAADDHAQPGGAPRPRPVVPAGRDAPFIMPKTDDGRVLFAIPWHGRVSSAPPTRPSTGPPSSRGRRRRNSTFCSTTPAAISRRTPTRDDVLSLFAGLRPLISPRRDHATRTAGLSREHAVVVSDSGWSRSPAASGPPTGGWPRTPWTSRPGTPTCPRTHVSRPNSGSTAGPRNPPGGISPRTGRTPPRSMPPRRGTPRSWRGACTRGSLIERLKWSGPRTGRRPGRSRTSSRGGTGHCSRREGERGGRPSGRGAARGGAGPGRPLAVGTGRSVPLARRRLRLPGLSAGRPSEGVGADRLAVVAVAEEPVDAGVDPVAR